MKNNQTARQLFDELLHQITVYDTHEAKEIVFWLLEHELSLRKTDILANRLIDNTIEIDWHTIIGRLNAHEPVQYILGETTFYGRKFLVNSSVLIPRPETEELIALATAWEKEAGRRGLPKKILDIGTGSGCIAVSLAKELSQAEVIAYDISEGALNVAGQNALLNEAKVSFEKVDILRFLDENALVTETFDLIVSNPPYVTQKEAEQMRANVLDFEPHMALFVDDTAPLVFYEAIANLAAKALKPYGVVMVEINENLGNETADVFVRRGFQHVELVKDIHQKNRFVKAAVSKNIKKD